EKGIRRVVIGTRDPFSKVNGQGIAQLQKAGVEVIEDILKEECKELNKRFFTFHRLRRPYVFLKWAESADGYLDRERKSNERGINWITGIPSKIQVHKWRHNEDAILVGVNTILHDN